MGLAFYRGLVRLLPRAFREEFGAELCAVVEEHREALGPRADPLRLARFWGRQLRAVLWLALSLRLGRGGGGARGWRTGVEGGAGFHDDGGERMGADDGFFGEGFAQDLRHSARSLLKRPGFTAVTALTLGLGVGATTVVFSSVHTVLLRDLPYDEPDRIVAIRHVDLETGELGEGLSAANAADLAEHARLLDAVAIADPYSQDLQVDGRAEGLQAWAVAEGFFRAAGAEPVLGRGFRPEEFRPDGEPVVLLGYRSWRTRFGADPAVVGRALSLDGADRTVVGVLPPWFDLPTEVELWLPRPPQDYDASNRRADYMTGIGRLAPGATLEQAQAEADRLAASFAEAWPQTNRGLGFRLVPLREHMLGDVRTPLLIVLAAVGLVLLIACANVAGLMLARGVERGREYALRGALGAGSPRLVRLVALESFTIAALGCVLGIALAWAGIGLIQGLGPDHLPRIEDLSVNGTMLLFAVAAAGSSAFLAGLAPALRLSRPDLTEALGQGSRGVAGSRSTFRLRGRLVVGQIAVAMVLLVGAGLLGRSFLVLLDQDLGFTAENRLAVQIFAYNDYGEGGRGAFVDRVIDRMEGIPGVERVALTSNLPGSIDGVVNSIDVDLQFVVEDQPRPEPGEEPVAWYSQVSRGFFEVLDIPIVEGRSFEITDDADAPAVIVVNETLARRHFGDRSPLGQTLLIGTRRVPRQIVGVAGDVRPAGHQSQPRPEIYAPLTQVSTGSLTFVVQTAVPPAPLTQPVLEAIWQTDPTQSVWGAATLESLLGEWLLERRFNLVLLGGFAGIALLLVAVGIYGLVSFSVQVRSAEMGIRRALGGPSASILRMVLGEGTRLAVAGVVLGGLGALLLTRFIQGMLFGVRPTDPGTFLGLAAVLVGVAALAALVPAVRAVRADPLEALRSD